jgi:hypothetical protein
MFSFNILEVDLDFFTHKQKGSIHHILLCCWAGVDHKQTPKTKTKRKQTRIYKEKEWCVGLGLEKRFFLPCCSMYSESDTSLHGVERPKADLEPKPKRMKSVCSEPISPKRFWELKHYGMKRPKAIWEEGLVLTPAMSKDYFSILSDLESEQSRLLHAELNFSLKKSIEEDELYLEQSRNLSVSNNLITSI